MDSNPIAQQQIANEKISHAAFNAKFVSKAEVFRFMVREVKAFFPKYEEVTIWHPLGFSQLPEESKSYFVFLILLDNPC